MIRTQNFARLVAALTVKYSFIAALALVSPESAANRAGVNFSGAAASDLRLAPEDSAGLIAQKFWNDASGLNGQTAIEIDGGTSIPVFVSGFSARWQAGTAGGAGGGSQLPNSKLMRGSLLATSASPALVQVSGIPISYTSVGYSLLVYCDAPQNETTVAIKATIEANGGLRTLYMADRANADFSGTFVRGAFTSSTDLGAQTPSGNVVIFTGLTATDLALTIEPAGSNPQAVVAVNAIQLIPSNILPVFPPRITGNLEAAGTVNEVFSYKIETDTAVTAWEATGLPPGLTIDPLTSTISGVPQIAGNFSVTLKASNGGGFSTETLSLTVTDGNNGRLKIYLVPAVVLQGEPGETHLVEYADALGDPDEWRPVSTVTLTNAVHIFVDLNATNSQKRFYRSTLQP